MVVLEWVKGHEDMPWEETQLGKQAKNERK